MEILLPELELPELQFQYTYEAEKYLRIYSGVLEPFLVEQLVQGKIRMQVWLERDQYKACGKNRKKRSWVHSRDYSGKAPSKLFSADEYDYGGGKGWGWGTIDGAEIPGYTTTNGCVPTEFEITGQIS